VYYLKFIRASDKFAAVPKTARGLGGKTQYNSGYGKCEPPGYVVKCFKGIIHIL
jgi:hypothetical protein